MTIIFFFFSSRRRHTRYWRDWSSDVCSSDLEIALSVLGNVAIAPAKTVFAIGCLEVTLEGIVVDGEGARVGIVVAFGHGYLDIVGRNELKVLEMRALHVDVDMLNGGLGGDVLQGEAHLCLAVGDETEERYMELNLIIARLLGTNGN